MKNAVSLNKDNAIGLVDETRALRTNFIWSKGRVEYTKLTVLRVNLRLKISLCALCSLWLKKQYNSLSEKNLASLRLHDGFIFGLKMRMFFGNFQKNSKIFKKIPNIWLSSVFRFCLRWLNPPHFFYQDFVRTMKSAVSRLPEGQITVTCRMQLSAEDFCSGSVKR